MIRVAATIVLEFWADDEDTAYRKAEDVMDALRHDPDLATVYGDDRGDGYIVDVDFEEEGSHVGRPTVGRLQPRRTNAW